MRATAQRTRRGLTLAANAPIVVATGNRGKLVEIREILAELPIEWRSLAEAGPISLPEEGAEYEANALGKARAAAAATGLPAVGDDSGLEVDALDGGPGPLSARYGGPGLDDAGRVDRLLAALAGVEAGRRGARFVCWAALALPGGGEWTVRGECAGRILEERRGTGGFGYDPVFQVEGGDATMAELPAAEKNRISHRARAFLALADRINEHVVDRGKVGS